MSKKIKESSTDKKGVRKLFSKRRVVVILVILLVVFGLRYWGTSRSQQELEVATVTRGELTETISASGEVVAEKSSDLAFLATGDIKEILVTNGQEVKKGQVLARVDSTNLYQAYLIAEADLRNAQATLDRVYDDVKDNDDDESLIQKETRTSAETAKDKAYRAFVIAQKNLSNSSMRAPFDGVVSISESASTGVYASPAITSFTVTDPSTVYFTAEVDESDINKISNNQTAIVELDAFPDQTFSQNVKFVNFVSTMTNSGGTAYKVGITLPVNVGQKIKLGMNGKVSFITNSIDNVLLVPDTSIVEEDGVSYVWVVDKGNAVKTIVETGASSSDETEIVTGVTEGQQVVVRPPANLEEGAKVTPV